VDALQFPPPNFGNGITPIHLASAMVSLLDITYTKSGQPQRVRATSRDPLSPFRWAGKMWDSSNSGTFNLAYDDGSFSASGSFSTSGFGAAAFGRMGTERNGSFLRDDDFAKGDAANVSSASLSEIGPVATQRAASVARSLLNAPKPKGRVPVPASGP
jgi:hypothetical protein